MSNSDPLWLQLSERTMYPPLRGGDKEIKFGTEERFGENVRFSYDINGKPGPFKGLDVVSKGRTGHMTLKKEFLVNYTGTWPARLNVTAVVNNMQDTSTVELLDTRNFKVSLARVEFHPWHVMIPSDQPVEEKVVPLFFDERHRLIPQDEIDWKVELVHPEIANSPWGKLRFSGDTFTIPSLSIASLVEFRLVGPGLAHLPVFKLR